MAEEELQNKMWANLPDYLKAQLCIDYKKALEAFKLDPRNVRIETHIKFLECYFGKSNLIVTDSEPTPKFKVGDKVKIVSTNNIALQDKVGIVAERPEGVSSDLVRVEIPSKSFTYLEPCQLDPYAEPTATEGTRAISTNNTTKPQLTVERARKEMAEIDREIRDPEKRKQIDEEWNKMLAEKEDKEHNVSETVKDSVDWMGKLGKAVEEYKTAFSEICNDYWQHYRMELAAKIAVAMITATQSLDVERVMDVTDGIVERLKDSER